MPGVFPTELYLQIIQNVGPIYAWINLRLVSRDFQDLVEEVYAFRQVVEAFRRRYVAAERELAMTRTPEDYDAALLRLQRARKPLRELEEEHESYLFYGQYYFD